MSQRLMLASRSLSLRTKRFTFLAFLLQNVKLYIIIIQIYIGDTIPNRKCVTNKNIRGIAIAVRAGMREQ